MSTIKANAAQIGQSATPTNNFTLYQPAVPDGTVRLGNGNAGSVTDVVTVTSGGAVGIGTTSPAYPLSTLTSGDAAFNVQSTGTIQSAFVRIVGRQTSVNEEWNLVSTGAGLGSPALRFVRGTWTNTPSMLIDSSGNVGIGTTSPSAKLDVSGAIRSTGQNVPSSGAGVEVVYSGGVGYIYAYDRTTPGFKDFVVDGSVVRFNTGNTERARIDSSGNLLVGTTSAVGSSRLALLGSGSTNATNTVVIRNSSSTNLFIIRDDGYVYAPYWYNTTTASAANVFVDSSGGLLRSTSSLRYKINVQDSTRGLVDVLKLRSVTYNGKNDGDKTFGGFIAEEVDAAGLTEFVVYDEQGRPDALHYGNMVALMAKAIQELKAEVDSLKAQLKGA